MWNRSGEHGRLRLLKASSVLFDNQTLFFFVTKVFKRAHYKLLGYFKLNYSTNLKLYLRLFYVKLIYVILSY